jgi:hypothetical protein
MEPPLRIPQPNSPGPSPVERVREWISASIFSSSILARRRFHGYCCQNQVVCPERADECSRHTPCAVTCAAKKRRFHRPAMARGTCLLQIWAFPKAGVVPLFMGRVPAPTDSPGRACSAWHATPGPAPHGGLRGGISTAGWGCQIGLAECVRRIYTSPAPFNPLDRLHVPHPSGND